jgi:hypothetical protein
VLSPDGGFGWSNVRLVPGGGRTLLIDKLFDLALTAAVLAAMDSITPTATTASAINWSLVCLAIRVQLDIQGTSQMGIGHEV